MRARQAVFGEDGCLKTIRTGQCGALLLDSGASGATKEKYLNACKNRGVPMALLPPGLLHEATGKPGVAMAVLRGSLAEQVLHTLPEFREGQPMKSANNCGGANV